METTQPSTLDLGLSPRTGLVLTWWGNATLAIMSGQRSIVIDPYYHPLEPSFEYIFSTHEHYDHAYPETIKRLITGKNFKKAILPRSCLYPSTRFFSRQLAFLEPEQYQIFYPKYFDHSVSRAQDTEYVGHSLELVKERDSPFPGPDELWLDDWHVVGFEMVGEDAEVPFPIVGPMPQLGYFIEDLRSGVSFYHFGDNHWTYPEMGAIRGKVDIMFLPIGKMGLEEDAKALDYMEPKVVIPVHWRYPGDDYPIPHLYENYEPPDQQIRGYHLPHPGSPPYPGQPSSPFEYIAGLKEIVDDRSTELVQIQAGIPYEIL
jgi:hypothetical protein